MGRRVSVWAHYKRAQRLCPPQPCNRCGDGPRGTVAHHVDHNPRNTVPENLERLCRACHMAEHRPAINAALRLAASTGASRE